MILFSSNTKEMDADSYEFICLNMIMRHWKVPSGDFREKGYDLLDHCYSRTRPFQFDVVKVQNIISRAMHKKVETVRTSGGLCTKLKSVL